MPTLQESYLTPSEKAITLLVAEGLEDKEIAQRLHISRHTVVAHLKNARSRCNTPNRVSLVVNAYRLGIIKL